VEGSKLGVSPRTKKWNTDALRKWLSDNPIQEEPDIDFLTRALEHHRHVCIAVQSSNVTEQEGLALNWSGNVPFLRLIHCVVDDSIVDAYRNRDMVQPGRIEVENRNSSVREENVWQKNS
jgi:hypothetical protein